MNKNLNLMRWTLAGWAMTFTLVACQPDSQNEGEGADDTKGESTSLTRVGLLHVKEAPFTHSFAVQGNVETDRIANVLPEFAGVVTKVLAEEGDQVRAGQELVRLNADVLIKQRAELEIQLDLAKTLFERQERLWNKEIGSEVDYLQARTSVEALERSLATLDEQLDKAVIRAPFDGVLDRVFVNMGEMASPPMPVLRIVDVSDLYVRAAVSDHYAGVVEEGQKVRIEALGLDPVESHIRRVGQFIESANRTIDLTIDLPAGTRALPNMVATVHITDLDLENAVSLPSAIVQQDASGEEYVYVLQRDTVAKRVIQTGLLSNGRLLIREGLRPGDQVIERGASRVVEGEKVARIESRNR